MTPFNFSLQNKLFHTPIIPTNMPKVLQLSTVNAPSQSKLKSNFFPTPSCCFSYPSTTLSEAACSTTSQMHQLTSCHFLSLPMIHSHMWQWRKQLLLRKRILRSSDSPLLFQIFDILCSVFRAIASLRLISAEPSLVVLIGDPSYSNCCTTSIFWPSSKKSAPVSSFSSTIIFVFLVVSIEDLPSHLLL